MELRLDAAIDKVENLERNMEINRKHQEKNEPVPAVEISQSVIMDAVAEPECQYAADAFEAYQQKAQQQPINVSDKALEVKLKSR